MSDFFGREAVSNASSAIMDDDQDLPLGEPPSAASRQPNQMNLFAQANHVADSLRAQVTELERRERNLNEQLAQFDREQRGMRLRLQAAEEESQSRTEQLSQLEKDFAERFQSTEQLLSELKLREKELTLKNEQLEQQRATLKQQLERQIDVEKATLQHSAALADSERKQLAVDRERLQREQHALIETVKAEINQEKQRLRKEYAWELDGEIENFRQLRESWANLQSQERNQLEEDRRVHEEAVRRLQADWAEQRRTQQTDLDGTKRQLEQQRLQQQREHEEGLRRLQLNWESERQQLRAQWGADLDKERQQFEFERSEYTASCAAERSVLQREREAHEGYIQQSLAELKRQRDEHSQRLQGASGEHKQLKASWERQRQEQIAQLTTRELELNSERDKLAKSWQAAQAEIAQRQQNLDLRAGQLTQFRQRLDEREEALAREAEAWQKLLAVKSSEVDVDRRRFEREQTEWSERRLAEESALRGAHERRLHDNEKLDARRQRLELMRSEMDNASRQALEARIATEEAWAEMLPQVEPELARRRIDAGRGAIAEHYRRLRDELEIERQALTLERLQTTEELRRDQERLRLEREQLPTALAFREEQLRLSEQRLKSDIDEWESRETRWHASRSQWQQHRLEAEQVIRGLLAELDATQAVDAAPKGTTAPITITLRPAKKAA